MEDKAYLKQIGKRIKELRKQQGYKTQTAFAEKHGFDRGSFARIEAGGINSTILKLKEIADALEVDVSQLVSL